MLARNCQDMQNTVVTVILKSHAKKFKPPKKNAINRITDCREDLSFLVPSRFSFVRLKYAQNCDRITRNVQHISST